ncbi:GNAT family N-acetyltransferase [Vibrio genomosp. F10]|uniref:GNAT family N-acetyltransferase n=1 Tax=Vibrio genomosp. F10 TaxID=723171 RepID=UPI0002DCEE49|nr:GNAT family N-acetyltransferase [Vibrio genomosp. F10]OEF06716.1 GNAT family N-acetyltransferase [Vibrio genomosp. F10 str. 9ZB36]
MLTIRKIQPEDDAEVSEIIAKVGQEYGAVGEGYGPGDAEVANMSAYYKEDKHSQYLVACVDDTIVGGGGVAPFGDSKTTCELKKLFLLPSGRGLGVGKKLTLECLQFAKSLGYTHCYLDTLSNMTQAISLYEKLGFKHLDAPLDGTIHSKCDVWMTKEL